MSLYVYVRKHYILLYIDRMQCDSVGFICTDDKLELHEYFDWYLIK